MLIKCNNIDELQQMLHSVQDITSIEGLLFCFGSSFISQLIMAKTRKHKKEAVPSHVAMIKNGFIYESTTDACTVNNKHIPSGVRRWQLKDFIKVEKNKQTKYAFYNMTLDSEVLENYVHYPYGKDTILDYLLKDGSDGVSYGLICSQYANYCAKSIKAACVTPAELFRHVLKLDKKKNV